MSTGEQITETRFILQYKDKPHMFVDQDQNTGVFDPDTIFKATDFGSIEDAVECVGDRINLRVCEVKYTAEIMSTKEL